MVVLEVPAELRQWHEAMGNDGALDRKEVIAGTLGLAPRLWRGIY